MPVIDIQSKEHLNKLLDSYTFVIIDVYADWCNPCKVIAPKYEELSQTFSSPESVFCKVNIEKQLIQDVKGLPSFLLFQTGTLVHTIVGADINKLTSVIETMFKPKQTTFVDTITTKSKRVSNPYKTYSEL